MRKDISKVLTEKPRTNRCKKYKRLCIRKIRKDTDLENCPTKISMKKIYTYYEKSFSDLLAPLRGFLFKAARENRNFDSVYSEIKKVLKGNGTLQRHVFQHLYDYLYFKLPNGLYIQKGDRPSFKKGPVFYIENNKIKIIISRLSFATQELILIEDGKMRIFLHKEEKVKKEIDPKAVDGKEVIKINNVWYWVLERTAKVKFGYKYKLEEEKDNLKLSRISKKDLQKYNLN